MLKYYSKWPPHIKKEVEEVCTHFYAKEILKNCPTCPTCPTCTTFSTLSIIIIVCLIIISSGLLIYFTIL